MTDLAPEPPSADPAHPVPQDQALRGLLTGSSAERFVERENRLRHSGPDSWGAIEFPLEVSVELASLCNLRCPMCPVPTTVRPPRRMDEELFLEVTEQLAREEGFVFLPQGFGESMLHPRWAELMQAARDAGIGPFIVVTNGTLLTERNIERLVALQPDALILSIDGVTPETYAAVRVGARLEQVEANILRLIEARGDLPFPRIGMRIIDMPPLSGEIDAFRERWRTRLRPGDEIHINPYIRWAWMEAHRTEEAPERERGACRMLWSNLSVHADGRVSACCQDSEGELIVGDATRESLVEIWNGSELGRLRELHVTGRADELPICRSCTSWR